MRPPGPILPQRQDAVVSKRTLINLGKYLLALGLLVYVVWSNWAPKGGKGLGYVWQTHVVEGNPIQGWFLLAAFLLYLSAAMLTLFRWYLLVRAVDLPFRVVDAIRLGFVGLFFNAFLPGSVGGDIIKAAFLAREQSRRTVAVATVIMDRVIALWALIWFVALMGGGFWLTGQLEGPVAERSKIIVLGAAGTVVVSVVVWLLLGLLPQSRAERFAGRLERIPRVGGSAAEFWRAVWMYRCRQRSVATVLALSWVGHVGFVLAFWCSAQVLWSPQMGAIPTLAQHFLLVPMGLVVQALFPTPGGAGGGELGFGGLYKLFGAEETMGVLGSLVQRVISWVIGLFGYLVYLRMRVSLPAPAATAAPDSATVPALRNGERHRQPSHGAYTPS
jgi:uncharacterized protein (TIRG00374 family)